MRTSTAVSAPVVKHRSRRRAHLRTGPAGVTLVLAGVCAVTPLVLPVAPAARRPAPAAVPRRRL